MDSKPTAPAKENTTLRKDVSSKPISRLFGILKRPGQPKLSIEEINEAIAAGWAGEEHDAPITASDR